jgi:hypothetical protein
VVLQPPKQLKKKKKQKNCSILWIVVFALELWFVWKSPSTLSVGLSQFSICSCHVIDAKDHSLVFQFQCPSVSTPFVGFGFYYFNRIFIWPFLSTSRDLEWFCGLAFVTLIPKGR